LSFACTCRTANYVVDNNTELTPNNQYSTKIETNVENNSQNLELTVTYQEQHQQNLKSLMGVQSKRQTRKQLAVFVDGGGVGGPWAEDTENKPELTRIMYLQKGCRLENSISCVCFLFSVVLECFHTCKHES
jgi:hypothetical protein